MTRMTGRWRPNLAEPVSAEVAAITGLSEGEQEQIEAKHGDILLRRTLAQAAAKEIALESQKRSLGRAAMRKLIDEGRRR